MKIENGKFVAVSYDLKVGAQGEELELMERASKESPLTFIYGTGQMLEAFETALTGMKLGEHFSFSIAPEDAYGEFDDDNITDLPLEIFKVEGEIDRAMLAEGNVVPLMTAEGQKVNASVIKVNEETVTMDFNHPLAGETLHFEGEILEVRDTTPEEVSQLIASLSGGCGSDCSGCSDEEKEGGCTSCGCH